MINTLTQTYGLKKDPQIHIDWESMLGGLTDAQCAAAIKILVTEHNSQWAPGPGQFYQWAKRRDGSLINHLVGQAQVEYDSWQDKEGQWHIAAEQCEDGEWRPVKGGARRPRMAKGKEAFRKEMESCPPTSIKRQLMESVWRMQYGKDEVKEDLIY